MVVQSYNAQDYIMSKLTGRTQIAGENINSAEYKKKQYMVIFNDVQQYIVSEKLPELTDSLDKENNDLLKNLVETYISRKYPAVAVDKEYYNDVVSKCLADMTGFSFLNKYLAVKEKIEEININAWDTVKIRWRDGREEITDDKFHSPQHAKDVMLRILRQNGQYLDENKLYSVTYIGSDIRITVLSYPLVDKDVGIIASIRFIHPASLTTEELVKNDVITSDMAKMLELFVCNGVSVCFAGATGSGKTTLCNALVDKIPDGMRLITLEAGTREFELRKHDETGKTINDRVHLQTRPHREEELNVDLQTLLDLVLKLDPEVIVVGEMVSEEAFIASETARTGHTVMTTIHSNSAFDAYDRMRNLGKRKYDLDDDTMLKQMVDAYPVVVYIRKYPDGKRHVQSIVEAHYVDKKIVFNELYKFVVDDNYVDEKGHFHTEGSHVKTGSVTEGLKEHMLNSGATKAMLAGL